MHQWDASLSERFEEKFGISPKSLVILFSGVGITILCFYLAYFKRAFFAVSDLRGATSLTKIATITRVDPNPPLNIFTVNFGKGASSQTETSLECQVNEKVIATYQIGKSGRYYIEDIQPIKKPERRVLSP